MALHFQLSPPHHHHTPSVFWVSSFPLCHQASKRGPQRKLSPHQGESEQRERGRRELFQDCFCFLYLITLRAQWNGFIRCTGGAENFQVSVWEPSFSFQQFSKGAQNSSVPLPFPDSIVSHPPKGVCGGACKKLVISCLVQIISEKVSAFFTISSRIPSVRCNLFPATANIFRIYSYFSIFISLSIQCFPFRSQVKFTGDSSRLEPQITITSGEEGEWNKTFCQFSHFGVSHCH